MNQVIWATIFIIVATVLVVPFVWSRLKERKEKRVKALKNLDEVWDSLNKMPPEKEQEFLDAAWEKVMAENNQKAQQIIQKQIITYGEINRAMICPHCQTKGKISTKYIDQKKGVSGGKATAALLTGGISLLAVGLSRKEAVTQVHCGNCSNTWLI